MNIKNAIENANGYIRVVRTQQTLSASFALTEDEYRKLSGIADNKGMSINQAIRQMIEDEFHRVFGGDSLLE